MESGAYGPRGLSGEVIGGYRLESEIAEWGGGIVYVGRRVVTDFTLPNAAAVEVLGVPAALDLRQERAFQASFHRRMEALQRLRDPYIEPVLAWGEDESQPFVLLRFVVMPDCDARTLASQLGGGPLPLEDAARIASQLAEALDDAHAANVTHGAVVPARILFDTDGRARLAGFEIDVAPELLPAAEASSGRLVIHAHDVIAEARAADIRALAGVLYEMVTGRSPFVGCDTSHGLHRRLLTPMAPPRHLRPDLPAAAEAAIMRGLAVEAGQPFESAGELGRSFSAGVEAWREEAWPTSRMVDPASLEQRPTTPMMAIAPERPTAPLMPIPPRTGQLVWARRPRPRWYVAAVVAVILLFVLALVLIVGLRSPHTPGASTHATEFGTALHALG